MFVCYQYNLTSWNDPLEIKLLDNDLMRSFFSKPNSLLKQAYVYFLQKDNSDGFYS